jgi:hypothetical protein
MCQTQLEVIFLCLKPLIANRTVRALIKILILVA